MRVGPRATAPERAAQAQAWDDAQVQEQGSSAAVCGVVPDADGVGLAEVTDTFVAPE